MFRSSLEPEVQNQASYFYYYYIFELPTKIWKKYRLDLPLVERATPTLDP